MWPPYSRLAGQQTNRLPIHLSCRKQFSYCHAHVAAFDVKHLEFHARWPPYVRQIRSFECSARAAYSFSFDAAISSPSFPPRDIDPRTIHLLSVFAIERLDVRCLVYVYAEGSKSNFTRRTNYKGCTCNLSWKIYYINSYAFFYLHSTLTYRNISEGCCRP